nr:hypothetical protein [uncultured Pseudomonas sp.]
MSGSVDLFLKDKIAEVSIVNFLNRIIARGVESLDFPNKKAALFLQYFEYAEGFQQSVGLAWGLSDFELDDVSVAGDLAKEFSTQVLFQPLSLKLPVDMEWCLVTSDGGLYAVNVLELSDGVTLSNDGTQIRLASR